MLIFGVSSASADFVPSTYSFDLTTSNLGSSYTGDFTKVTVDLTSSTTATITFDALKNGGYTYMLTDGGSVAVNVNATTWTLGTVTGTNSFAGFSPGPYTDTSSVVSEGGGTGSFNQTIKSFDSFTHSATEITFTLTNTSGTWATATDVLKANADGNLAAAHIGAYDGTSTSFAATGFAGGVGGTDPNVHTTPAPPSVVLLGIGGLALGGFMYRSRRRQLAGV